MLRFTPRAVRCTDENTGSAARLPGCESGRCHSPLAKPLVRPVILLYLSFPIYIQQRYDKEHAFISQGCEDQNILHVCLFMNSLIQHSKCSRESALLSHRAVSTHFPFPDCPFFTVASPAFRPCYIPQTPPATFLSLGITIVLKSHGFRITGVGLGICILTPLAADPREPHKKGMSPLPPPGARQNGQLA